MSQIILTSLYNHLVAVQTAGTIYDLVGGRIFQMEASQATARPLLVFTLESEETQTYMSSAATTMHTCDVSFTFFFAPTSSVATAMVAEAALFLLLHKASITPSDASYASITTLCTSRGVPTIADDSIVVESRYRLVASKQS